MKLQFFKLKEVFEKTNLQRLIFAAVLVSGFLALGAAETIQAQPKIGGKTKQIKQVLEAERILSSLGYWIIKVDNVADSSTRHALIAFQKVEGRKRTGVLNNAELQALRNAARPVPKSRDSGMHIEIDLSRQVLFLVDENGTVTRILPVSGGNEKKYFDQGMWQIAHTPRGNFTITRRINGVRHSTLGALYYPNYFTGGVAIHGSNSIPVFPASHGCVRIPNFAAKSFFDLVSIGTPVLVYD